MATKSKRSDVVTRSSVAQIRENEGVVINAKLRHSVNTDGSSSAEIGVELNNAPVPARRYVAEVCSVSESGGSFRLTMGQPKIVGDSLRSALVILLSEAAVKNFLGSLRPVKDSNFQGDLGRLPLYTLKSEPDHTVTAVANFVIVGVSGDEACLDFYHASAFAFAAVAGTHKLAVEPVVRVDMRTGLFWSMVDALKALTGAASSGGNEEKSGGNEEK